MSTLPTPPATLDARPCFICGLAHPIPATAATDPYGPLRSIVAVDPVTRGRVMYSCGHRHDLNPTMAQRVGDMRHCVDCAYGCPVAAPL